MPSSQPVRRRREKHCWAPPLVGALLMLAVAGCGGAAPDPDFPAAENAVSPVPTAPAADPSTSITVAELRKRLGVDDNTSFEKSGGRIVAANLAGSTVTDLAPLEGLPLRMLDLSQTKVSDLSPLAGSQLTHLYLEATSVADIAPLQGLPLRELWLKDSPVVDLAPLAGMPLDQLSLTGTQVSDLGPLAATSSIGILWLRGAPVADLAPLRGVSITSLDVQDTVVVDLSPLADMTSLQRLNIAGAPVTDLRPIAGLSLTRLIFTPDRVTEGLDAIRQMPSLRQLDVQFEDDAEARSPAEFWRDYDQKSR